MYINTNKFQKVRILLLHLCIHVVYNHFCVTENFNATSQCLLTRIEIYLKYKITIHLCHSCCQTSNAAKSKHIKFKHIHKRCLFVCSRKCLFERIEFVAQLCAESVGICHRYIVPSSQFIVHKSNPIHFFFL